MDELISRQTALDAITDERIVANMDSVYDSELHRCKRATCSECGWANEAESGFVGTVKGFKFCPNCSADMRQDDPSHPFADSVMMKGEEDENNNQI